MGAKRKDATGFVLSTAAQATVAGGDLLAILYSDGSMNVLYPSNVLSEVVEQARDDNLNQKDPLHLAKVVRVRVQLVEILEAPQ